MLCRPKALTHGLIVRACPYGPDHKDTISKGIT